MKISVIAFLVVCAVYTGNSQSWPDTISPDRPGDANPEIFSISGYARGSAFMLGENYDYATLFSESGLKSELNSNTIRLHSDLRFRTGLRFDERFTEIEFREIYASYLGKRYDITMGNQIVSWGRTDGFNPTANINPTNYFFFSSEPNDQIMSNFMLRLRYRISQSVGVDIAGIPFYLPSRYRFDLFGISPFAYFSDDEIPARTFKNSAIAARLNFELPQAGFSFSYFNGYDPMQGFSTANIQWEGMTPRIRNAALPYRKQSFGMDMEIPISLWIIRSEIAYNHICGSPQSTHIPVSNLYYVFGIERELSGTTVILQYIGRYIAGLETLLEPDIADYDLGDQQSLIRYANDMIVYETALFNRKIFYQQQKADHAVCLILSRTAFYDLVRMEFYTYFNFSTEEFMLRPRVIWRASDNLSFSAGGQFMAGPEKSLFDYSRRVFNGVFLEMKAGF
jgi:hypothetical protein